MNKDLMQNIKAAQELREQMEEEPWIRIRNSLVYLLVSKRRELGVSQADLAQAMCNPAPL